MAGLSLYGDLELALQESLPVRPNHRLESVKILPHGAENKVEMWARITADAAARVEIQAQRQRCFSMSVATFDPCEHGEPTSWSAGVDALAAGRVFDVHSNGLTYLDDDNAWERPTRLFVVCTGNVQQLDRAHLDRSDAEDVHDPGQAWNALTVGAYTEKATLSDPQSGTVPISPAGELSPWSATSVPFSDPWPIKPEIVFEGGNACIDSGGNIVQERELELLTTFLGQRALSFTTTWATSAATAQVARIAACVMADYPDLWPETVRGLIVHSARWTPPMQRWLDAANTKEQRDRLVRRYGYGVPDASAAVRSASDALTLVAQGVIRPFDPASGTIRELHLHDLPWPADALRDLGSTTVELRITLSYFIEPNPSRRGWRGRYSYPSHALRFKVIGPTESIDEFQQRINKDAREDPLEHPGTSSDADWYLGPNARDKGSIHSDMLEETAARVAERHVIAVHPVGGWWKHSPKRDRSDLGVRYALIVSIETDAEGADIWTPVANQVSLPVEVEGT